MSNKMWLGTELYNGCFGKKFTQKEINYLIDLSIDIDVCKIDTAECYNIENNIGKAMKGRRNKFVIATKFGHQFHKNGNKINKFDLNSVQNQLATSLKLLNTDYIDLYYFHSGSSTDFCNDELWQYLNNMQKKGIIKKLGLSLKHSLVLSKDYTQIHLAKNYGIYVAQTVLNMYSQDSLQYVIPFCKKNNIKIIGRMPFAKGLLTGKYDKNHIFKENDQRSLSKELNKKIISGNVNYSSTEVLTWCAQRVDEVIVGSKNKEQLIHNYNTINA